MRLTEEDINATIRAFVRAIAMNAPIHRDKDGKGPMHTPICVWEDCVSVDDEILPPYDPKITEKLNANRIN